MNTGNTRGFTVVELMLVSAVLGVLALCAVSANAEDPARRLDLLQRQIADALDYAKALARSSRQAHGVVFEAGTERLAVVDEAGQMVEDPLAHGDYLLDFLAPQYPRGLDVVSADFGDTGVAIVVHPEGAALSGGTVVIAFRGVSRTLTVDPATASLGSS